MICSIRMTRLDHIASPTGAGLEGTRHRVLPGLENCRYVPIGALEDRIDPTRHGWKAAPDEKIFPVRVHDPGLKRVSTLSARLWTGSASRSVACGGC